MKSKLLVLICTMFTLPLLAQQSQKVSAFDETVVVKENWEPMIPRPQQVQIAQQKLKALEAKTGKKPNILILLVDDMGWDIGAFGGGAAIGAPTPNMNKLAHDGKMLTSFYSNPTCTSSRAALMTGRAPVRSGLTRPILTGDKLTNNPWKIEQSNAKMLAKAGYQSALIGKWHIGEAEGMLPHEVGFDYFYGLPSVESDYSQFLMNRRNSDMINNPELHKIAFQFQPEGLISGHKGGPRKVAYPIKKEDDLRPVEELLKNESVKWLQNIDKSKPFLLVHAFSAIHNDTHCGKAYIGKSPAAMPNRDALVEVDDYVGQIMDALEATGELENTLVFLTSDNGPNKDIFPDTGYTPFRGGKGTTWEGGVRVPGIAYWKGMIEPTQVSNELMDLYDVYFTALSLGGVLDQLPSSLYYDGIDQTSFLLTENGRSHRQCEFLWSSTDFMAMRWRDYKVHFQAFDTQVPMSNIDMSYKNVTGPFFWLFNLNIDPKEQLSQGHRYFEWGTAPVMAFKNRHLATFKKYKNTDLGLGL